MSIWSAIARTLTAFAVLGLIVGALSAPAQARAVAGGTVDRDAAAQQEGVATPHVASMSEDMPCCDPEPSGPDCRDTKACPFAAACAAKIASGIVPVLPAGGAPVVQVSLAVRQDHHRPSLAAAPQAPPPRPRS
ncbi:hypothetical protein C0214_06245 [Methylobacterium sp. DM1]|jgi:hypothetical protein|uniref:Uncharacterized protein n=1 Tax=Methylorubrum extorquens (strain ATCC 14718 / DSM 1338 / JCM 2805 / NCIMB 9133 / AM1) TaxID=272630 RepID=C5B3L1_METEA|nr:Hypothetical protein MexAM1_META2p0116 [Methylorubrum extorquens AM1]AWI87928.1 hypothetical protein C0214_06245 [Methylobacterium sp. DM1]GEL44733.1 hypothetical protein MEX01_53240 [Methylorubrum extorquens]